MRDELEGQQFQGKALESFRDPKTRAIRVRGAGFWVVVQESGAITIHFEDRTVHVAPDSDPVTEHKPAHDADARSPRESPQARKRGSR